MTYRLVDENIKETAQIEAEKKSTGPLVVEPAVERRARTLSIIRSVTTQVNVGDLGSSHSTDADDSLWPMFVEQACQELAKEENGIGRFDIELTLRGMSLEQKQNLVRRLGVAHHYLAPTDVKLAQDILHQYVEQDIKSREFDYPLKTKSDTPTWLETIQAKTIYLEGMKVNYPGVDPRRSLLGMRAPPYGYLYETEGYGNQLIPIQPWWKKIVHDFCLIMGIIYLTYAIVKWIAA